MAAFFVFRGGHPDGGMRSVTIARKSGPDKAAAVARDAAAGLNCGIRIAIV
jgi:hypothetical protein